MHVPIIYTHKYLNACTHIYPQVPQCMYPYTSSMHVPIYPTGTSVHVPIYLFNACTHIYPQVPQCMYPYIPTGTSMHVPIYTHRYLNACTHIYPQVPQCMYPYIPTGTSMHVPIYTHTPHCLPLQCASDLTLSTLKVTGVVSLQPLSTVQSPLTADGGVHQTALCMEICLHMAIDNFKSFGGAIL